jgi:predicted RNA binding protein YcfA (HicA-like mRNA interferase family)
MPKLPAVTGEQAKTAFEKMGFVVHGIKGSHHVMKRTAVAKRLPIPIHSGKVLGAGLPKSLIRAAGITVDEFIDLL